MGYSVGKWDGDTLVVNTMGFNDLSWLDARGHGCSEDLRVEERSHRRDYGHTEVGVRVTNPELFTRPRRTRSTRGRSQDQRQCL